MLTCISLTTDDVEHVFMFIVYLHLFFCDLACYNCRCFAHRLSLFLVSPWETFLSHYIWNQVFGPLVTALSSDLDHSIYFVWFCMWEVDESVYFLLPFSKDWRLHHMQCLSICVFCQTELLDGRDCDPFGFLLIPSTIQLRTLNGVSKNFPTHYLQIIIFKKKYVYSGEIWQIVPYLSGRCQRHPQRAELTRVLGTCCHVSWF